MDKKFYIIFGSVNVVSALLIVSATIMMIGNYGSDQAMPYLISGWIFFVVDSVLIVFLQNSQFKYKWVINIVLLLALIIVSVYSCAEAVSYFD